MTNTSDEFATGFILLSHVTDPDQPDFNRWYARFPDVDRGPLYGPGDIAYAVAAARGAAYGIGAERNVKVAEGTKLGSKEILALIEANGGWPRFLDLTRCDIQGVDLSRDPIARERSDHVQRTSVEPPWFSDCTGGVFLWRVSLAGALHAHAQLEGADLRLANLEDANLYETNLRGANLLQANLRSAHLAEAQLQGAHLQQVQLQGAFIRGTQFQWANLRWAQLQGVDFYMGASLAAVRWYGARLDRTRMRRDQLGDRIGDELQAHKDETAKAYHHASEAYLLLKNNFNSIGRYGDAAWAYIKEQQMEKMAFFREWRTSFGRNWFSLLRWLRNWAYELLTGYGERAWLPILWAIAVILSFAVGYAAAGNVSPDFAGDPATAHGSHNLVDALTHSIGAFATIGFNTLEPLGWGARLLTAIESALGISLFALFIFTLGNRMSRS